MQTKFLAAEQNKIIRWSESPWNKFGRKRKGEDNAKNNEKWGTSWLKQYNFDTFRYISTDLDDKVNYFFLLNSCLKFYAKNLQALLKYQGKSQRATFLCPPCR